VDQDAGGPRVADVGRGRRVGERSDEGWAWMHSPESREWLDELAQKGWERYFRGEMPPPPDWAKCGNRATRVNVVPA
jgi:hypothetical protein